MCTDSIVLNIEVFKELPGYGDRDKNFFHMIKKLILADPPILRIYQLIEKARNPKYRRADKKNGNLPEVSTVKKIVC